MGKGKILLVLGIIAVIALAGFVGISRPMSTAPIMGYSGPVASFSGMDHNYEGVPATTGEIINTGSAIAFEWDQPGGDLFDILVQTGLRAELQGGINVGSPVTLDTITEVVVDTVAETNFTKNWLVQKVKCTMGVIVYTHKGGLHDTPGATFWVHIEENAFSVFQNADESMAFFINIYTTEPAKITGTLKVTPQSDGYDFPLTPTGSFETPQWVIDSGYTSSLDLFREVDFPISVLDGHPDSILGFWRTEAAAEFYIGIDVLLFGYWEETKDYRKFDGGVPESWLDLLLGSLVTIGWIIVGVAITIVSILKLKGKYVIVVILGVWLLVSWQLGWFDMLLAQLGIV